MASVNPVRLSTQTIRISETPRFFSSFNTLNQNLADSPGDRQNQHIVTGVYIEIIKPGIEPGKNDHKRRFEGHKKNRKLIGLRFPVFFDFMYINANSFVKKSRSYTVAIFGQI